jgi:Uma2 family endonuclease
MSQGEAVDLTDEYVSEEEYFAIDAASELGAELVDGVVFILNGAAARHNGIVTNLVVALGTALKGGPCRVFTSSQRVKLGLSKNWVYPDVLVACGDHEWTERRPISLVNPSVAIEVLSPSTANRDRGAKLSAYRRTASIREVLIVATEEPLVEHYARMDDGSWRIRDIEDGEVPVLDLSLALSDIYDDVFDLPA